MPRITVNRDITILTPMEMSKIMNALYTHSEYTTDYEYLYRTELEKLEDTELFKEVHLDYNIEEDIVEIKGKCLYKLALGMSYEDKNLDVTNHLIELDKLMDKIIDYIILETNIDCNE